MDSISWDSSPLFTTIEGEYVFKNIQPPKKQI